MRTMRSKGGFSLVELLTVIAIIAILAAIIFPVMSSVKERAKEAKCITNLHELAMGLQLYQQDNRSYPEAIGGTVQRDSGGQVIPFEQVKSDGGLYPEYTKSIQSFHCPLSITSKTTGVVRVDVGNGETMEIYGYDSYDAFYRDMVGPTDIVDADATKLRYCRRWSPDKASVAKLPPHPPGTVDSTSLQEYDYKRQLAFRSPSKDAVVTWCSYHAVGKSRGKVPVLFLDGHADTIPAVEIEGPNGQTGSRWRVHPKG